MEASPSHSVLTFRSVRLPGGFDYDTPMESIDIDLLAGGLLLIRLERSSPKLPFCDAASGLVDPDEGDILVLGKKWQDLGRGEAARMRSRIGRVFEGQGWINNLDVDENITLSGRYHEADTEEGLQERATSLATAFGLPQLPHTRPSVTSRPDLARAAWVRAFLAGPELLLLERPGRDLSLRETEPLFREVEHARGRGTAVVWLTDERDEVSHPMMNPTLLFRMEGPNMMPMERSR